MEFLKKLWCNFYGWITGASFFAFLLRYILPKIFEKWLSAILSKNGKPMYKRFRFLKYIIAHPALIPIILFCLVLIVLSILTYLDTRTPQESSIDIITPTPTLTSEQQIEENLELLETYLNNGECKTAFDELFTEQFQINWLYEGFCIDEWNNFTNIELSVKGDPNIPSSEMIGYVIVSIKREHINYLGTSVPTPDRKVCYKRLNGKWLIDEMYSNVNDNCIFR